MEIKVKKMRILMINNFFYPKAGSETYIIKVV